MSAQDDRPDNSRSWLATSPHCPMVLHQPRGATRLRLARFRALPMTSKSFLKCLLRSASSQCQLAERTPVSPVARQCGLPPALTLQSPAKWRRQAPPAARPSAVSDWRSQRHSKCSSKWQLRCYSVAPDHSNFGESQTLRVAERLSVAMEPAQSPPGILPASWLNHRRRWSWRVIGLRTRSHDRRGCNRRSRRRDGRAIQKRIDRRPRLLASNKQGKRNEAHAARHPAQKQRPSWPIHRQTPFRRTC